MNLYHYTGDERDFFAQVGIENDKPVVLRSFVSAVLLEDYSHYVRLPEL